MKGKRGELDIRGQLAASTKDLNTSATFSNKAIVILTTERKHTEKRSKKSKIKKKNQTMLSITISVAANHRPETGNTHYVINLILSIKLKLLKSFPLILVH